MDFSGDFFTYDGVSSEHFGLAFLTLDTSEFMGTGGNSTLTDYRIKTTNKTVPVAYKYAENLSFDVEILGKNLINADTHRAIMQWISNKLEYKKLFINNELTKDVYLLCRFTSIEKIEKAALEGYGIVGYKATIQCDAPWAWQDIQETFYSNQLSVLENIYTLSLENASDVCGYIYPKIKLKLSEGEKHFEIKNISDNKRVMKIDYEDTDYGIQKNEILTFNPENLSVTSSVGRLSGNIYKTFNKLFIRFVQGVNSLEISSGIIDGVYQPLSPFEITISYSIARAL